MLVLCFGVSTKAQTLSLQEIKQISDKQFECQSEGNTYEVYLFSENGKRQVATQENGLVWAGAGNGDTIASGDFKIAYTLKGSQSYKTYNLSKDLGDGITLNMTQKYISVIDNRKQGIADFLTIYMPQGSSNGYLFVYAIHNGTLQIIPFFNGNQSNEYAWIMRNENNEKVIAFSSIGNLKYKSVYYDNTQLGGYYMSIYKYNSQTKRLEQSGETTRWLDNKYCKAYPFTKPYAITNQEAKELVISAHLWLMDCLTAIDTSKKGEDWFYPSIYPSKKSLECSLGVYWSSDYIKKLLSKYSSNFIEKSDCLYIVSGDFGLYYDLDTAKLIKVEDYGNKKKVFLKAKSQGDEQMKTLTYMIVFTNHGWVLQDGGSDPFL